MNVRDIVTKIESMVRQVEDIDAAIADIDKRRGDLVALRVALSDRLAAVDVAVGDAPAAVNREPKASTVKPPDASTFDRFNKWIAAQTGTFSAKDVKRAFPDANHRYVGWLIWNAESRKQIVRVERGCYMRKPEPKDKTPIVTPDERQSAEPAAGTRLADALAWARAQRGEFAYADACAAIKLPQNRVAVMLGSLRNRGFLERVRHGVYRVTRSAPVPVVAEAAE